MRFYDFLPTLPLLPNAACREYENPNIFFPESGAEERKTLQTVRSICGSCIERKECLEYALSEEIAHGTWGGFTSMERKKMISERRKQTERIVYAKVIRKMTFEGASPKEIATTLGVEVGYVNQILSRDRAKLEGELQSQPKVKRGKPTEESSSSSGFPQ